MLAGGCARPELVRAAQVSSVAQPGTETVLEGSLEVIIEDAGQGSRTRHFLIFGERRVPLRFTSNPPTNLITGTRVRVKGRWEAEETLVVSAIETLRTKK